VRHLSRTTTSTSTGWRASHREPHHGPPAAIEGECRSFTNGMPMTSSLGCGIWGGNITQREHPSQALHADHLGQPSDSEDRPSDQELFRRVLQQRDAVARAPLHERLSRQSSRALPGAPGVRHVFGLCGHTNIAVLSAMAQSKLEFVNVRHEQVAAHAADGYARATGKASVLLTHLGPGASPTPRRRPPTPRSMHPDGRHCRRRILRTTSASTRIRK
jgi:hypothetical protein